MVENKKRRKGNLMVTVAASVEQNLLIFVFLGVQNVVTAQNTQSQQQLKSNRYNFRDGTRTNCKPFTAKLHGTHGGRIFNGKIGFFCSTSATRIEFALFVFKWSSRSQRVHLKFDLRSVAIVWAELLWVKAHKVFIGPHFPQI